MQFHNISRFSMIREKGRGGNGILQVAISRFSLAGEGGGGGEVTRVEMVDRVRKLGLKHHHY
jgi:hypothetical protein